jgi:hypothetical protein
MRSTATVLFTMLTLAFPGVAYAGAGDALDQALSGVPGYRDAAKWKDQQEQERLRTERMRLENELLKDDLARRERERCLAAAKYAKPGEVYDCR